MGFVKAESWVVQAPPRVPDRLLRALDRRWLRDSVAFLFSFVVVAGLVVALLALGEVEQRSDPPLERSISTFDIASVSAQAQGASSATAPPAEAIASTPVNSVTPPIPPEWSVTTLPPLAVPAPPVQSAAIAPAPVTGQGMSTSGTGSGAGYDPYAFASYQKPDPARLAGASTPALQPLPEALTRLSAALLRQSGGSGRPVGVRAYVDASGRVLRTELLSTSTPELAQLLARIAPGFMLCAPDPARPSNASLIVTLMA